MDFVFRTEMNREALTAGACALRKTLRRRRNRILHLSLHCITFPILGLGLFVFYLGDSSPLKYVIILALFEIYYFFQDSINGYLSKKMTLKGAERIEITFYEENYVAIMEAGTEIRPYTLIAALAEAPSYFILVLDRQHVVLLDKTSLEGGSIEAFRTFIENKTSLKITPV